MGNFLRKKNIVQELSEHEIVLEEMRIVSERIEGVRSLFSAVSNCDLIEAYVFELESLEAKRRFLWKRAKELGLQKSPFLSKAWDETA